MGERSDPYLIYGRYIVAFADYGMTHRDDFPSSVGTTDIGYTCKLKVYPDGSTAVTAADRPIFRPSGWECRTPLRRSGSTFLRSGNVPGSLEYGPTRADFKEAAYWAAVGPAHGPTRADFEAAAQRAAASLARSKRRALTAVRDYALSNSFQYFVTLTLDAAKIDRYDYDSIISAMRIWCDNQVRRKGLKYILVPEHHKDGALHFHGFFPEGVSVADSGTIIPPEGGKPRKPRSRAQRAQWLQGGGHIVYNLPDWGYGYSTAISLYGSYHAAVAYVCKYISKAPGKIGGRWYFSGGKLAKPDIQFSDASLEDVLRSSTAREYSVPAAGLRLAYDMINLEATR